MTTETTNYLSPAVIAQAISLLNQGDVSGAWQVLADNGDAHTDNGVGEYSRAMINTK